MDDKELVKGTEPDHVCVVDVYDLEVAFFWTFEKYAESYAENFDIDVTEDACETVQARASWHVVADGSNRFAIYMSERADWWTYAHECSHMVDFICECIGMPMNMDTTEPRAYLLAFLFKELSWHSPHLRTQP